MVHFQKIVRRNSMKKILDEIYDKTNILYNKYKKSNKPEDLFFAKTPPITNTAVTINMLITKTRGFFLILFILSSFKFQNNYVLDTYYIKITCLSICIFPLLYAFSHFLITKNILHFPTLFPTNIGKHCVIDIYSKI